MEPWEEAWLAGDQKMPLHGFPHSMQVMALEIIEKWCEDQRFLCVIEEWVPRTVAKVELVYLLQNGYHLRGQLVKRERPIPVIVQLLYWRPHPSDFVELKGTLRELFTRVVREWIQARERFGDELQGL